MTMKNTPIDGKKGEAPMPTPIWMPCLPANEIPINLYRDHINRKFGKELQSSQELHQWSIENLQSFWIDIHEYVEIIPRLPSNITQAFDSTVAFEDIPKFFQGARINYAENVLTGRDSDKAALIGIREGRDLSGHIWTWELLRENVRKARSALVNLGIEKNDRVAAIISTSVWSVALFLASASIGAIWTSIAPDLGETVSP